MRRDAPDCKAQRTKPARRWLVLIACAASLVGCSGDPDGGERTASRRERIVFGTQTLLERFQLNTFGQGLVNATGVLVRKDSFQTFRTSSRVCSSPTVCGPIDSAAPNFCQPEESDFFPGQRAVTSPRACSAFLVGPDLFATAGHCIADPQQTDQVTSLNCSDLVVVMRWWADPLRPVAGSTTVFDSNNIFLQEQVYECAQVMAHGVTRPLDLGLRLPQCAPGQDPGTPAQCIDFPSQTTAGDWALFKVRPIVTNSAGGVPRRPLALSRAASVGVGDSIIVASYPNGLPAKLDLSGLVVAKHPSEGRFEGAFDARFGGSGGPVMDLFGTVHGLFSATPDRTPEQEAAGLPEGLDPLNATRNCLTNTRCEPGPHPCHGNEVTEISNLINGPGVPTNKMRLSATGDFDGDGTLDTVDVTTESGTYNLPYFSAIQPKSVRSTPAFPTSASIPPYWWGSAISTGTRTPAPRLAWTIWSCT